MSNDVEAELALCAAEIPGTRDESLVKGVRFDVGELDSLHSSLPAKHGKVFDLGPAYLRKCVAAWAAARQRAIDLASVVDGFEGNFGRLLRTDVTILNDDRRVPFYGSTLRPDLSMIVSLPTLPTTMLTILFSRRIIDT